MNRTRGMQRLSLVLFAVFWLFTFWTDYMRGGSSLYFDNRVAFLLAVLQVLATVMQLAIRWGSLRGHVAHIAKRK